MSVFLSLQKSGVLKYCLNWLNGKNKLRGLYIIYCYYSGLLCVMLEENKSKTVFEFNISSSKAVKQNMFKNTGTHSGEHKVSEFLISLFHQTQCLTIWLGLSICLIAVILNIKCDEILCIKLFIVLNYMLIELGKQ